jgi:hypothetical protein
MINFCFHYWFLIGILTSICIFIIGRDNMKVEEVGVLLIASLFGPAWTLLVIIGIIVWVIMFIREEVF